MVLPRPPLHKDTDAIMAAQNDQSAPSPDSPDGGLGPTSPPPLFVSAAAELIVRYLGRGDVTPGRTVWMNNQFGRASMVQLQTWRNGAQTVIIMDSGRSSWEAVSTLDLGPADGQDLRELEKALRQLTTLPPALREDGDGPPPRGTLG